MSGQRSKVVVHEISVLWLGQNISCICCSFTNDWTVTLDMLFWKENCEEFFSGSYHSGFQKWQVRNDLTVLKFLFVKIIEERFSKKTWLADGIYSKSPFFIVESEVLVMTHKQLEKENDSFVTYGEFPFIDWVEWSRKIDLGILRSNLMWIMTMTKRFWIVARKLGWILKWFNPSCYLWNWEG